MINWKVLILIATVALMGGLVIGSTEAQAAVPTCVSECHYRYKVVKAKNIKRMNKKLSRWNAKGYHIRKNLDPWGYKFKLRKRVCRR